MKQTTRKQTESMSKWTRRWILDEEHAGWSLLVSFSFQPIQQRNFLSSLSTNREARENAELAKHRAERPKIQQQFADLKRGLAVVTDEEWENIPEVGNLTRKKRKRDERSFVVPDSVIVGDRSKTEYENALDARQQDVSDLFISIVVISSIVLIRKSLDWWF